MSQKVEITNIIVGAIVSLTIAFSIYWYTSEQNKNTITLRYIELAIDILKQPNTTENKSLKEYAIKTLKEYSAIPFDESIEHEFKHLNFFLSGYKLDIEENQNGQWAFIGGTSTFDLSKVSPVPSKTIRWHIKYPFNAILEEDGYKVFEEQKNDKAIKEFIENAKKEHAAKYNVIK